MMAGAMRERVDILMEPSRDTKRSSQGTVAAKATANIKKAFYKIQEKFLTVTLVTVTQYRASWLQSRL